MSQHLSGLADWIEDKTEDLVNLADHVHKEIDKTEIGRHTTRAIGGTIRLASQASEWVNKEAADVERHGMNSVGDIPFWLVGSFNKGKEEAVQRGADFYSDRLNVDPRVYEQIGGPILSAVAEVGVGGAAKTLTNVPNKLPPRTPQLVTSSGGIHLQFAPDVTPDLSQQVFDITIKNPEFIAPGVREGISKDPDIAKQIVDRSDKVERQANRLETWRQAELNAKTKKEKAVAKKNQKKATADLKSQMSNMPQIVQDDPIAYRVAQFKDIDKIEQHHLISKAQTAGYYDQMDYLIERGLADHDDLVAMGEYAKMRGAASGDRLSNMLNMNKIPHNEYHTYLRDSGQEIKPEKIREIVRKAKTSDQLMELYKDFIDNQILVKQDAIAYQKLWDMDK